MRNGRVHIGYLPQIGGGASGASDHYFDGDAPPWHYATDDQLREAGRGDFARALFAVPEVQGCLHEALAAGKQAWREANPGKKILLGALFVLSHGAALGFLVAEPPDVRGRFLAALDGIMLPVPGVPGVMVQAFTKEPGGMIRVNVLRMVEHFKR